MDFFLLPGRRRAAAGSISHLDRASATRLATGGGRDPGGAAGIGTANLRLSLATPVNTAIEPDDISREVRDRCRVRGPAPGGIWRVENASRGCKRNASLAKAIARPERNPPRANRYHSRLGLALAVSRGRFFRHVAQ